MDLPDRAREALERHFASVSKEQFVLNLTDLLPPEQGSALIRSLDAAPPTVDVLEHNSALCAFDRGPTLRAYLASALTGLGTIDREDLFRVSDLIAAVCKRFDIDVYQPRHHTDPVHHPQVSDTEVFRQDRDKVLNSDMLILVSKNPSFGAGEELDFAYSALVPILIVSQDSERVSRMVTGIPGLKVHLRYGGPVDLEESLRRCLPQLRPVLATRRASLKLHDANIVGERIRFIREEQQLTREQVADKLPHLTAETLKHLEESKDLESNPTLLQLRQTAAVLNTTVSDLVEPDFRGRMLAALQDWLTTGSHRHAARGYHISERDRRVLLRRTLLRLAESLEDDTVE